MKRKIRQSRLQRVERHVVLVFALLLSQKLSAQIIDTLHYSGYNGIKKLVLVQAEKGKIPPYLDLVINPGHASLANTFFVGLHSQASLHTGKYQLDIGYAGMVNKKWQSYQVHNITKPTFTTGIQVGYNVVERIRIKHDSKIKGIIQRKSDKFKKGKIHGPRPTRVLFSPTIGINFTQYESKTRTSLLNDKNTIYVGGDSKLTYLTLGTSIQLMRSYSTVSNNSEFQTYRGHRFQIYFLTALSSTYNMYQQSKWNSPYIYTPVDIQIFDNLSKQNFGWSIKYDYLIKSNSQVGFNFGLSVGQIPHQVEHEIKEYYDSSAHYYNKGISLVAEFHIGMLFSNFSINKPSQ